jgi:hypothetical protein
LFIVPRIPGTPESSRDDIDVLTVSANAAELARALDRAGRPVLLHYVNYGYEKRGCPDWLIDGIERWRRSTTTPLVTVFHEIYAFGPPWRSSFWNSPRQRSLAKRLALLSDECVTSLSLYAAMLRRWVPRERVVELPVFSTVGEPQAVAPLAERAPRLALFGSRGVRRRAIDLTAALRRACELLEVSEIVDIGPPMEFELQVGIPVRSTGWLESPAVSSLLADCRAGFVSYPPGFLGKSTIFAAYAAHGLLPIRAWPGGSRSGVPMDDAPCWHLLPDETVELAVAPQVLANAAWSWYQGHTVSVQAAQLTSILWRQA